MRPDRQNSLRQRGFSLVLAVFLLVSLAAMGAYLLTVSGLQQESVIADEQGTRAYQSARTGVEWAAYQILRTPGGAFATACNAGPTSQTLTLAGGLSGYAASVACSSSVHTEGATSVRVYAVTSTGCNRASCPGATGAEYVERQLQLTLTN